MDRICFNCNHKISNKKPICPYCFVVQRKHFSRENLFDFLEIYFPSKPNLKERFENSQKKLHQRNYDAWIVFGILTFGIAYYYYLLLTLEDLNDHWFHHHGYYEETTKNDVFISFIILLFINFIGVPLIQYVRYNKLRNHLLKAPPNSCRKIPPKGSRMFWLYFVFNILFIATGSAVFFGVSSVVADKYIPIDSTTIAIIFFTGAGLILFITILIGIMIILIETRWQEAFNYHITWHLQTENQERNFIENSITSDVVIPI
ncbi:MAG TPA: hypothetical protein VMX55_05800 [candidate division Zixibacteria bacterium]|nr:hypothetical protein [candidate division Zixibacteria bacterium]